MIRLAFEQPPLSLGNISNHGLLVADYEFIHHARPVEARRRAARGTYIFLQEKKPRRGMEEAGYLEITRSADDYVDKDEFYSAYAVWCTNNDENPVCEKRLKDPLKDFLCDPHRRL